MRSLTKYLTATLLLAAFWAAACTDGQEPVQPEPDVTLQAAKVPGPTVIAALDEAIQGEYYLQVMYAQVLEDVGDEKPFSRVVKAETKHVAALAKRYTKYQMDVPASTWTADNVPTFETKLDACAEALVAEAANVAMYDALLLMELPAQVQSVFTTLREASLENHVPAFTRCK